jgi:transcriptional regulator of acetoin/glycerol metabolism
MKTDKKAGLKEREKARRAVQSAASRVAWPISEGAHRIGVGRTSVYKMAAQGKIRLVRVAGRTLI